MGRKKLEKPVMDWHAQQSLSEFGKFVKCKRERLGFTMRAAAEEIGISSAYISDIENGKERPPSQNVLDKMVEVFKLKNEDKKMFYQLANKCRGTLPAEIVSMLNQNISLFDVLYRLSFVRDLCVGEDDKIDKNKLTKVFDAISEEFKKNIKDVLHKEFPALYDENGEIIEELQGLDIDF